MRWSHTSGSRLREIGYAFAQGVLRIVAQFNSTGIRTATSGIRIKGSFCYSTAPKEWKFFTGLTELPCHEITFPDTKTGMLWRLVDYY